MTDHKNDAKIVELESLLKKFSIPFNRKYVTLNNLMWLKKNLSIKNQDNPRFEETHSLVIYCINNKIYYS